MKKWIGMILAGMLLSCSQQAKAQQEEIQQLLLNIQKLAQLKSILSNLKKGYDILFTGYNSVKSLSEGSFQLHDNYLASLLQASPEVTRYGKVARIISAQLQLYHAQRRSMRQLQESRLLTPTELTYLRQVYDQLGRAGLQHLEVLTTLLSKGALRMSDGERLAAIDKLWSGMEEMQTFFQSFEAETKVLLLQRTHARQESATLKRLYSNNR